MDDENEDIGDFKIAKKSKENKDKKREGRKETKKEIKKDCKRETPKEVKKEIRHEKIKKNYRSLKHDYKSLQIESPESFDYASHDQDWCRYCGARYSSNFTKGPWGPRTLCTIHYIEWNQKKKLNLNLYKVLSFIKNLPLKPINSSENTEINYLNNMKSKNPEVISLFHFITKVFDFLL